MKRTFAAVKASSLAEAQAAAKQIKVCLKGIVEMQNAAAKGEWQQVFLGLYLSVDVFVFVYVT